MTVLGDVWGALPKEIKFIFGIAVFLYAGATILNALVIAWNIFGVNALNLVNGCMTNTALCIPQQEGIFIFGINFADYWTITIIIIFVPLIMIALKWYSLILGAAKS